MEFLTPVWLIWGMTEDEAAFVTMMATLNRQRAAIGSNPRLPNWSAEFQPITDVLYLYNDNPNQKTRAAAVVEALYLHCGIPLDQEPRPNHAEGDLMLALRADNYPAFHTLLVKCGARPNQNIMNVLFPTSSKNDKKPYLRLLLQWRHLFPALDPNALFKNGENALHAAAYGGNRTLIATDPDPETVRLLIDGFGADPRIIMPVRRQTALDIVVAGAQIVRPEYFKTVAAYRAWRARVDETVAILQRAERAAALMMVHHPRLGDGSHLQVLAPETMRRIEELSMS